ncbi:hypothetical protein [Klebsiella aerogenes]|uniref:hypothetical protein n=1 Tax=Klebsiella aerogenes TaxID=548 RepID=UPI001BCB588F|nr:hypothetical protein [Klebsiella aerogenes]HDS6469586.1 hypothetical protein [Klebsiella aerogenes]
MNNEIELTAALLTIEKCRELSGCPAGVDLQDWVKQLAAENVALKEALWWLYEVVSSDGVFIPDEKYSSVTNAAHVLLETPATDRIVAEVEARGVEKGIAHLENKFSNIGVQIMNLQWLADSLREGAE